MSGERSRPTTEDEEQLTAFALGELDAEAEREVRRWVERDPELGRLVQEIRATAELLRRDLADEPLSRGPVAVRPVSEPPAGDPRPRGERQHRERQTRPPLRARPWLAPVVGVGAVALVAAILAPVALQRSLRPAAINVGPASGRTGTPIDYAHSETADLVELPASNLPTATESLVNLTPPASPEPGYRWGGLVGSLPPDQPGTGVETPAASNYADAGDSGFLSPRTAPYSTFGVDVDTASYSQVRLLLRSGHLPPAAAVRVEELLNHFTYRVPPPGPEEAIAIHADVTDAPWNGAHLLARVALKARDVDPATRGPLNLVFLIDVSGSMGPENRLPLVKRSLVAMLERLRRDDTVAIVVYAGSTGVSLAPTPVARSAEIRRAIEQLQAGGSTYGSGGIQLAYEVATRGVRPGAQSRVVLATDGDFNLGLTTRQALVELIEEKAKSGVFLTVLGFGMSNLRDATLEQLADHGNGSYAFIDDEEQGRRVLRDQLTRTLFTVAKDVKVQVELNPEHVESYRLIGYENRALAARDFKDDTKDGGEMGAGETVTVLYELVPARRQDGAAAPPLDPLRYQDGEAAAEDPRDGELMHVKVRYKEPDAASSKAITRAVHRSRGHLAGASEDLRFAAAVAAFGMVLRGSPHKGSATLESVARWAEGARGDDASGERSELVELVRAAQALSTVRTEVPAPKILEPFDEATFLTRLRQAKPDVDACVAAQRAADPNLRATLRVHLVLQPNGRPTEIRVEPPYGHTLAAQCLVQAASRWRFVPYGGPATPIDFPVRLGPEQR